MKKKIINNGLLLLAVTIGFTSCEKKLELFPYNSIELSQSFKTMNDAKAYDNVMFSGLRGRLYGSNMFSQDVQADQLNASIDFGNRNGNPHRWGSTFQADDGTISGFWSGSYSMMKNVNAALEGYTAIPVNTPAEQAQMNIYMGNAYMSRAYLYSELIIRYAKPYEPATAATDLGVPLVLRYNPQDRPGRATVKEVYTQILNDLSQAKTLLASVAGAAGATRYTIHSVKALEARVKMNMQDWAGAKAAADDVINSNAYPLHTTAAGLKSMWVDDNAQEVIQQAFVSRPNELANANSIYLGFAPATSSLTDRFIPDFLPSKWVVDKYDNTDLRKNVYFGQKRCYFNGMYYDNVWVVDKYPGNPLLFTTAVTNYQQAPKVFRVAELYLIAAEAAARMMPADETAARLRLNTLRMARGLTAVTSTGAALMNDIKDERFRELAFEGFRLWDLKRWHEGFTRSAPQNLDIIQTGSNYNTLTIPVDDPKFTWAIPTRDITTNPGLAGQQNPGW